MWRRRVHSLVELAGKDCKRSTASPDAVAAADVLRKSELAAKGKWVALPPVPSLSKNSLSHMVLQKPNNVTAITWLKRCCPQISQNDAETLFRTNQVKLCKQGSSETESQEPELEKVSNNVIQDHISTFYESNAHPKLDENIMFTDKISAAIRHGSHQSKNVTRKRVLTEGSILYLPNHLLQLINKHRCGRNLNQISGT